MTNGFFVAHISSMLFWQCFFSQTNLCFIKKKIFCKVVHTSHQIFLHHWHLCWKFTFDTEINLTKKVYHHDQFDGEQQLSAYQKLPIKWQHTSWEKRRMWSILVMFSFWFLRRTKMYNKKWGIPIYLFDKSCTNVIFCTKTVDLQTGKIIYFSFIFLKEKDYVVHNIAKPP